MVILFVFLRVAHKKEMTFLQKMRRIDYLGNAMVIASSISILFALTYGGARYPWSSWRIILPLVLGFVGLVLFCLYESLAWVKEPVMPPRLFKNRTSAAVMVITFLNSMLLFWAMYFLPVYFQAVQTSSPKRAGVQLLPLVLVAVPGAIVAVIVLTKFGRYRPLHHLGLAITTIGVGLFTMLNSTSSQAEWVLFQVIAGLGSGMVLNTLLPACQAPLAESDQAAATATWAFIRSFGSIWGAAIPGAIFSSRCNALAYRVSDPAARGALADGQAYEHATSSFVRAFTGDLQQAIIGVYNDSLQTVWQVAVAFSGLAFLLVFLEKEVPLRKELDTEYGLEQLEKEKARANNGTNERVNEQGTPKENLDQDFGASAQT
jgi:Major Facilitator Superfamily